MINRSILLSDAWAQVKAHLRDDLLALRETNDSHAEVEVTASNRGQIEYIKKLLALDQQSTAAEHQIGVPGNYDL